MNPRPLRHTVLPLLIAAATLLAAAAAPASELTDAVDGPARSTENRARDAARHPVETLEFFGVTPQQTVIEVAPGGGWYTEILAPYLRERGHLYAAHSAADDRSEYARAGRQRYADKLARSPAVYDRVVLGTLPVKAFTDIRPPGGADAVLTFRNVHNWIEAGHLDDTLKAFFDVLKPGGVLGIEEHRAPPGTPLATVIASGYVPEELVIARARAAGFELVARSEVNANPKDTKDHASGVWSLPPVRRAAAADTERDRARYDAIGESDRMTLKFRKPPAAPAALTKGTP